MTDEAPGNVLSSGYAHLSRVLSVCADSPWAAGAHLLWCVAVREGTLQ